jgi:dihydropteroate synthase
MKTAIQCAGKNLDLSAPVVMGILNITPDSFSDGGELLCDHKPNISRIAARSGAMIEAGATILDVGGESTRPGAQPLAVQQELDRVIPVVELLSGSVDTSTPEVMLAAAAAGAHLINDVRALGRAGAMDAALRCNLPVCLMHMQGQPDNMQDSPHYHEVVAEVSEFLASKIKACIEYGFHKDQLLIDPGFGFGKTTTHNLELLARLGELGQLGYPLVVGLSRKRSIGEIVGRDAGERLYGSLAAAVIAVVNGASIVRTHDVQETVDALKVVAATQSAAKPAGVVQ